MTGPGARCLQGDATLEASYQALLGAERADLLLTDPPYCLLTRRRKGGDLRDPKGRKLDHERITRFESVREYRTFTAAWLPKAAARLTPTSPLVIWTNFLGKQPLLTVAGELGFTHLWGEFTWAKTTTERSASEQLLRVYEVALVLSRQSAPALTPADPPGVWAVVAGYDEDGEAQRWGSHPNHKPFSVLAPLVRSYSRPGGRVLDPFAGSGSIPAAAVKLGRAAACLEIDGGWAARVGERLESASAR